MLAGLEAGDLDAHVQRAWIAAQELRLAYFDTGGVSNGPTEAINGLIKKIKRVGHGYRNFANYRLRLLLHCGVTWHTPNVTPIRGRPPRLAASHSGWMEPAVITRLHHSRVLPESW
jgi:Transposase